MAGGLHFESIADMPAGMRRLVAVKISRQAAAPAVTVVKPEKKGSKYHAQKTVVRGIAFDSKKEAQRFMELLDAQEKGYIRDLRLQEEFTLQPAFTKPTGERVRAIRYLADFTYVITDRAAQVGLCILEDACLWNHTPLGTKIIEDAKGMKTDVYRMKAKMMEAQGHHIREV